MGCRSPRAQEQAPHGSHSIVALTAPRHEGDEVSDCAGCDAYVQAIDTHNLAAFVRSVSYPVRRRRRMKERRTLTGPESWLSMTNLRTCCSFGLSWSERATSVDSAQSGQEGLTQRWLTLSDLILLTS